MKARTATFLLMVLAALCGVVGAGALLRVPAARSNARIDDLSVSADEILALSPDVAKIEVLVSASRPTHRIIHIADSHYLSREEYRILPSSPSEEGYTEYTRHVEELQKAQFSLLCWLVDDCGLRNVFVEGVSEETLPQFVDDNLKWQRQWQESRAEVRALASRLRREIDEAEARGEDATTLRARERDAEKYLGWRLNAGAVRDLLTSRPRVTLLPAEDEQIYQRALQRVDEALELRRQSRGPERDRREAAIVHNLVSRSSCAVIILGGGHDLSKQVKRLGAGRCEYVRVIPKGFPKRVEHKGRTTWVSE